MLEVQKYLHGGKTLDDLKTEFGITAVHHPLGEPLVILNYSQIDSPKTHPLVRECRGLVLEKDSWEIVAKSFNRFFNYGEAPDTYKNFCWNLFWTHEKVDGSLMIAYKYKDRWYVNTRNSFGQGEVPFSGRSWEEWFYQCVDEVGLDWVGNLAGKYTLVFEFVSPYNKVVRRYPEPALYLLTVVENETLCEVQGNKKTWFAEALRVKEPECFTFNDVQEVVDFATNYHEDTYEGVVVFDGTHRIKIKNPRYVALHHLFNNGNVMNPKELIKFIWKGETSEIISCFPEAAAPLKEMQEKIDVEYDNLMRFWEKAQALDNQKDFAIMIQGCKFASVLFNAKKRGIDPSVVWKESQDLVLTRLF